MVIHVCTVVLENLVKNYATRGIDISFSLSRDDNASSNWREEYVSNLNNLLCGKENIIVDTLRKLFVNGSAKDLLNPEDWQEIRKNNHEGSDYCIRVFFENQTLCLLSKREIK